MGRLTGKINKDTVGATIFILAIVGIIVACIVSDISVKNQNQAYHDECIAKAPYFAFKQEGVYMTCERVLYASKAECIADGREKDVTDKESGEPYHIYCQDDGTWSAKWTGGWKYQDELLAEPAPKYTCKNVTSYDYNWQNDMECTAPDGTTFYTSYEGANYYENL